MINKTLFLGALILGCILAGAGCIEVQEDTSGMRTKDIPRPISSCGDRLCDEIEASTGSCPRDCNPATSTADE
ncbi:MAG: hypothetical protein ACOYUZ_00065 [Patescibacteria group bacterium]